MQLADEVIERLLARWPVARLATLAPDGRPRQVPVVFAAAAGALWSPLDAKPKSGAELARLRDLSRDPRASLLLDHYDDDWSRLWWLRVEGRGIVVRPADPGRDPGVAAAVAALERKYPQYRDLPLLPEPATLIRIEPLRRSSWCASAAAGGDGDG